MASGTLSSEFLTGPGHLDAAHLKLVIGEVVEEKLEACLTKSGGVLDHLQAMWVVMQRLEGSVFNMQESLLGDQLEEGEEQADEGEVTEKYSSGRSGQIYQLEPLTEDPESSQVGDQEPEPDFASARPRAATPHSDTRHDPPSNSASSPELMKFVRALSNGSRRRSDAPHAHSAGPSYLQGTSAAQNSSPGPPQKKRTGGTKKTLDVYNLDSMHTDQLLQDEGLYVKAEASERAMSPTKGFASLLPTPSIELRGSSEPPEPSRANTTPNLIQHMKDAAMPSAMRRRVSGAANPSTSASSSSGQAGDNGAPSKRSLRRNLSPGREKKNSSQEQTTLQKESPSGSFVPLGSPGGFFSFPRGQASKAEKRKDSDEDSDGASIVSVQPPIRGTDGNPVLPPDGQPQALDDFAFGSSERTRKNHETIAEDDDESVLPGTYKDEDASHHSPGNVLSEASLPAQTPPMVQSSAGTAPEVHSPNRHESKQSVYNLDAMHTDKLLENSGLTQRRQASKTSTFHRISSSGSRAVSPRPPARVESQRRIVPMPGENQVAPAEAEEDEDGVGEGEPVKHKRSESPTRVRLIANTLRSPVEMLAEQRTPTVNSSMRADSRSVTPPVKRDTSRKTTATSRKSCTGMDELRVELERDVVATFTSTAPQRTDSKESLLEEESPRRCAWLHLWLLGCPSSLLGFFGVLPFGMGICSNWYQNVSLLGMAALLAHMGYLAIKEPWNLYLHMTTACYALGGLLGVVSLRVSKLQNLLGPVARLLEQYATNYGFEEEWREVSAQRFALVMMLWFCMVTSRVTSSLVSECDYGVSPLQLVSFSLISGLMALLSYCQLHVCCGLELVIDKFCIRLHDSTDLDRGVTEWNICQAILRRSAHTIDSCFLALNTSVLATLLLTGVEILQGESMQIRGPEGTRCAAFWFGWAFAPVVLVLYTVFRAAAVTEKCSRVPALVNSWTFEEGKQLDRGRQYVVEYISNSAAGFYVKGVRLTAFMALKLSYIFGAVLFTSVTQYLLRKN